MLRGVTWLGRGHKQSNIDTPEHTIQWQFHQWNKVRRNSVALTDILSQIDREIALLQQARALLAGAETRPKKSPAKSSPAKKRRLSPEGRKRIAEAVKRRWAEQRKAAANK
jgi:hypothetical protein